MNPEPMPVAHPLEGLPVLSGYQVRLERALGGFGAALRTALGWLLGPLGDRVELGDPEVRRRASGLKRPGVNAQVIWPGRGLRFGVGIESVLVHALVDAMLGHERRNGEERLQVTPVESGLLSFVLARTLAEWPDSEMESGWVIDRVGPDPFDVEGLGQIATVLWPLRIREATWLIRFWFPESLVNIEAAPPSAAPGALPTSLRDLTAEWRAEAGRVTLPRGLAQLRTGGVVPIDGAPLSGTPSSPSGPVELTSTAAGSVRFQFAAEPVPASSGTRIRVIGPLIRDVLPREPRPMSAASDQPVAAAELPVTLVVELGRVNLTVGRVADLKPGAIIELGRSAREPVELTANGRVIARGELVQIDTELGLRVTNVLL